MVDDLVSKGEKPFATPADATSKLPEGLGPITREFFSRYGTLKTRRGGFELSVAGIRASDYVKGFLSIGHSEDWDVVQRLGKNEVFVVEGAKCARLAARAFSPDVAYRLPNVELLECRRNFGQLRLQIWHCRNAVEPFQEHVLAEVRLGQAQRSRARSLRDEC